MRYVWEVTATGGDPVAVTAAVERAIALLRGRTAPTDGLDGWEREVWTEDVSHIVIDPAVSDGADHSVLVDIDIFGSDALPAAVLSGGFDTTVLDEVMSVKGVTECAHSDRIKRVGT